MKPLFPRDVAAPKKGAVIGGAVYLLIYLFGLPQALPHLMRLLRVDITTSGGSYLANVVYFSVNFIVVALLFRPYLLASLAPLHERRLGWFFLTVAIGYGIGAIGSNSLTILYELLDITPDNLNNDAVNAMLLRHPGSMLLFTVVLAPITEECLFRGVLFAPFCRKCPWVGYVLSVVLFSCVHVLNSIGYQAPFELALCFLQYVPLSLALCWVCQKTKSIWGSITLHAFINAGTCLLMLLDGQLSSGF